MGTITLVLQAKICFAFVSNTLAEAFVNASLRGCCYLYCPVFCVSGYRVVRGHQLIADQRLNTGFGEPAANWGKRQEHAVLEARGLGGSSGKGIAGQSLIIAPPQQVRGTLTTYNTSESPKREILILATAHHISRFLLPASHPSSHSMRPDYEFGIDGANTLLRQGQPDILQRLRQWKHTTETHLGGMN